MNSKYKKEHYQTPAKIKAMMNEQRLYNPKHDKTIVVLGYTCSGKTTLCKTLFNLEPPYYSIIHTDDYIDTYGWGASLYAIMKDVEQYKGMRFVVEGVQ